MYCFIFSYFIITYGQRAEPGPFRFSALFTNAYAPVEIIITTVPIMQAIRAFFAVPSLSGAPAAVRYKMPVIIQPIITMAAPSSSVIVVNDLIVLQAEEAKAIIGAIKTTANKIRNNVFLFTSLEVAFIWFNKPISDNHILLNYENDIYFYLKSNSLFLAASIIN